MALKQKMFEKKHIVLRWNTIINASKNYVEFASFLTNLLNILQRLKWLEKVLFNQFIGDHIKTKLLNTKTTFMV